MKIFVTLFAVAVSFIASAQSSSVSNSKNGISHLINEYNVGADDLNRVYIFRDSPEYYERFKKYYNNTLQNLSAVNFDALTVSDKVDYILFKRNVNQAKENLEQSEKL